MLIIGLTGSICAGKSLISNFLNEKNYPIVNMDILAKELIASDENIKKKIIKEFGENSYLPTGEVNSGYLADLVFANNKESADRLKKLNTIVHPAAIDRMSEKLEEISSNEQNTLIFVESALIFELGLEEGFDYVLAVSAKEELRLKRAGARGLSEESFLTRQANQYSDSEKISFADFTIENNGSIDQAKSSLEFTLSILEALNPNK